VVVAVTVAAFEVVVTVEESDDVACDVVEIEFADV
jgi:hypothetical protein